MGQQVAVVGVQRAGNVDPLGFLALAQLQADAALQIPIIEALVLAQVLRGLRYARACQVGWRSHHDPWRRCQLAGDHR